MKYKFLDQINLPKDLRKFKKEDLKSISKELREKTEELTLFKICLILKEKKNLRRQIKIIL